MKPEAGVRRPCHGISEKRQARHEKQVVFAISFARSASTKKGMEPGSLLGQLAVVLKDEKGNLRETIFKGPIAKEVAARCQQ